MHSKQTRWNTKIELWKMSEHIACVHSQTKEKAKAKEEKGDNKRRNYMKHKTKSFNPESL